MNDRPAERFKTNLDLNLTKYFYCSDAEEESAYRADHTASLIRRMNLFIPIGAVIVILIMMINAWLFPFEHWIPMNIIMVVFFVAPFLILRQYFRNIASEAGFYSAVRLATFFPAIGAPITFGLLRGQGIPVPTDGVLVVIMMIFIVSGLRILDSSLIGLACLSGLIIVEWTWRESFMTASLHMTFGLVMWLICVLVGMYVERSDRRDFRYSRILKSLALRDPLTGLLNRRGFDERFAQIQGNANREKLPISVALIDIDHFKSFNDTLGHDAGDKTLVEVAEVIASAARRPLDIAARFGGEEFLVVWYGMDSVSAINLAEYLRDNVIALDIPHKASEAGIVTVSIGLVTNRPSLSTATIENLYRQADEALYDAKRNGRNRIAVFQHPDNCQDNN